MQNPTAIKRILVSFIILILFGVIAGILYYAISPAPTCNDGKQNQSEKGIDCGGVCSPCNSSEKAQDIVVGEASVVFGGNGTYDAVAKITNPNDILGASSFGYVFNLKDITGKIVATREGSTFVLPSDSRYVAELGFQTEGGAQPVSAELTIKDAKWEKLKDLGKPQIGVYSKNFGKTPTGDGNTADGIIRNESGYDLNRIFIVIVLRNDKGQVVGVNKTEKTTVRAKEERDFKLTWPYQFSAPVQNMEVDAQSNVFDPHNLSFSL